MIRRLCKTHPARDDNCLDCAMDHAIDQSPDGNSMVGLARLIPAHLQRAYADFVVSAMARELGPAPHNPKES